MASSISTMEFTSASSKLQWRYDVLINFTGDDIRKKFVSHLDSALSAVGFNTFLHEENAVKEMHIEEAILDLYQVAIVVFTKTFAQSAWCLHQLQEIIRWHQTYSRHVLPIYYEVEPSDVRLQKGDFGKAFKETAHQTFSAQQLEHGMFRWSQALTKAANFFGWDERNHRSDAELVDKICKSLLNLPILSATKFPVGLRSRVENVIRIIKSKSTEVCIIEICGRNQIQKDLFLDICCFFVGKGKAYATKFLNGCGVDTDIGIRLLMERNLIKINKNNKLGMHTLLQKMGITIIREISVKEHGKNRRLWFDKEEKHGTNDNKSFLPKPNGVKLCANSEYRSQKLRWMSLHGFPSEYLHCNFYVHDAIVIDLKHSLLPFVWKKPQVLRWLKVLNLSHSKYLKKAPDFSGLPSLEELILKDCPRLRQVHQSIICLYNLLLLNLKDCTNLSNLPTGIYELKSLRTLILSGCSKIDLMENDIVQMDSLITLIAENKAVKEVPFSIVSSKSIGYISLHGLERLPHNLFFSIFQSWLSPTMNAVSYIHSLCMEINNCWDDIAPLLSSLSILRSVLVQCDTEFQLSKQVKNILVEHFANITESGISNQHLRSSFIGVGAYHEFFKAANDNIVEGLANSESSNVSLVTNNDPYWLAHTGEGHSVSFTIPQDRDMKGMTLCIAYLSNPYKIKANECLKSVLIINYTKCTFQIHNHGTVISFKDEDWHGIMSNLESGDKVEIFVSIDPGFVVKNTTVYLICGESNNVEKETPPKKHSLVRFIKNVVS